MEMKLELVAVPVTDVDQAKAFYTGQFGFHADHDYQVRDDLRFVQLTPAGSACSIVIGLGITEMPRDRKKGCNWWSPMCKPSATTWSTEGWPSARSKLCPGDPLPTLAIPMAIAGHYSSCLFAHSCNPYDTRCPDSFQPVEANFIASLT
jgi:catechol 2,3-dioxygenase-like lactoylglutathione lyase family enzyme